MKNTMHLHTWYPNIVEDPDSFLTSSYPSWYNELKKTMTKRTIAKPASGKVTGCPSFIDLFKNSYLVVAPCDFAFQLNYREDAESHEVLINPASEFVNVSMHDVGTQMGADWHPVSANIKLMFECSLTFDKDCKMMFLHPMYHTEKVSEFAVMHGILPQYKGILSELNLNLLLNRGQCDKEHFIEKGTALAYLYFPDGRPKIKTHLWRADDFYQRKRPVSTKWDFEHFDRVKRRNRLEAKKPFLKRLFRL